MEEEVYRSEKNAELANNGNKGRRSIRFSPTSKIDGGGAQYIRWGSLHLLG